MVEKVRYGNFLNKNKIQKLLIIGLGSIGQRYFRILKSYWPNLDIFLLKLTKNSNEFSEQNHSKIYYSFDEVLKLNIDVAIVASPSTFHFQHCQKLLENSIHVLVEKPLAHKLLNFNILQNLIKRHSLIFNVGYTMHFDPAGNYFKKLLNQEKFENYSEVYIKCRSFLPNWRPNIDYKSSVSAKAELGGGVLLELSHEIDYAIWFFGMIKSVSCNLYNSGTLDIDVYDTAEIILKTESSLTINIDLDFCSKKDIRYCQLLTTNSSFKWDIIKKAVLVQDKVGNKKMRQFNFVRDDVFIEQIKKFFSNINENENKRVTIDDGINVLKVVEAANLSNKLKKEIVL